MSPYASRSCHPDGLPALQRDARSAEATASPRAASIIGMTAASLNRPRGCGSPCASAHQADAAQRLADGLLRPVLLHARQRSLPAKDLEDAFGQAVLKLLARLSRGLRLCSCRRAHLRAIAVCDLSLRAGLRSCAA